MTKFPKSKRVKLKKLPPCPPCWICGNPNSEWDHLQTRGSGGSDEPTNLQPLCRWPHHVERHSMSLKDFAQKYNLPISWEKTGYPRRTDIEEDL